MEYRVKYLDFSHLTLCLLHTTFANSLAPDLARQNIKSDLNPNCSTDGILERKFWKSE